MTRGAVLASTLFVLCLAGCAGFDPPSPAAEAKPQPANETGLSAAAVQALERAEAAVEEARARFALWTTARAALNLAREAARQGDSAAVLRQTEMVMQQTRSGLAQLEYPSTESR